MGIQKRCLIISTPGLQKVNYLVSFNLILYQQNKFCCYDSACSMYNVAFKGSCNDLTIGIAVQLYLLFEQILKLTIQLKHLNVPVGLVRVDE